MAINNGLANNNSLSRSQNSEAMTRPDVLRPPLKYGDPVLNRFFNSSIGFNELFDKIFDGIPLKNDNYPPYNLIKYDYGYSLEMAVAGFSREDINIYIENGQLIIEGKQPDLSKEDQESNSKSFIHHGLAKRGFKQVLKISSLIQVQEARLENGILTIRLNEVKPDPPDREYIEIR